MPLTGILTSFIVGGVVVVNFTGYDDARYAGVSLTPDDFSLDWYNAFAFPVNPPNVVSAGKSGQGWYVCSQSITNTMNVSLWSLEEQIIRVNTSATTPIQLAYTGKQYGWMALLHVTMDSPKVALSINFTETASRILYKWGSIPSLYWYTIEWTFNVSEVAVANEFLDTDLYIIVGVDEYVEMDIGFSQYQETEVIIPASGIVTINTTTQSLQLFRMPYNSSIGMFLAIVEVEVEGIIGNITTENNLYFGADGSKSACTGAGLFLSPYKNSFYLGPNPQNLYFVMNYVTDISYAVQFKLYFEPMHYLCDSVLLCNGHGVCPEGNTTTGCECITGIITQEMVGYNEARGGRRE